MPNKQTLPQANSVVAGFGGKTLNSALAYIHGSVFVVELIFSDSTTLFIKQRQNQVEVGGSNEWDTGTKK